MRTSFFNHRLVSRSAAAVGLVVAGAVGAAQCPQADNEALVWLDKMSRSLNQVSYHGVVTLQRGDDMQVMQVSHRVAHDSSSEELTELTGQGARVERTGHPLQCVHPGQRLLRLGSDVHEDECGISPFYRFSVADGERVAGRKAVQIRIQPQDVYRYGYLMELDRETGLLLKTETFDRSGRSLEKLQFADLSYAEQSQPNPETTEVSVLHHAHHSLPDSLPSGGAERGWVVDWLPSGFTITDTPDTAVGRRTYTDGLAVFSVFIEGLDREIRAGEGLFRHGGTTSYTRGMDIAGRPVLVTVIGEVPVNTARMVADSVRWMR